ncbi:SDR family NAD(P)-dependent oxidoreductase [Gordonia sp. TBRC 11910]|uniref:SDR family NAD(P)-dependent oxidoreductase n=1 Tax=Gordonia asplenii TaxID=2725283 RepID=A0A848KX53_9ACTN|nr:SDR family NAD(P)-dependent oxidoreductase [Gordonia asplenii]NMO03210.1 SDR family NAD(P)-dependent oxidoreductase [Gordonia asplenii]
MSRRTIVITGASDGIGAVAARTLAGPDVDLVIVGRSASKTAAVAAATGATAFTADFARFDDVRRLAGQIAEKTDRVDVLLNNAGGIFDPGGITGDGHEPNLQINHLSPFLLTNLLHDQLAAAGGALVVNTSSIGNLYGRVDFDDLEFRRRRRPEICVYGVSKLMNIMFANGIATRWSDAGIVSAAVHPGAVASSFGRDSLGWGLMYRTPLRHVIAISPEKGAQPLIRLARLGADPAVNGVYFHRNRAGFAMNPQAKDAGVVDRLWTVSAELTSV